MKELPEIYDRGLVAIWWVALAISGLFVIAPFSVAWIFYGIVVALLIATAYAFVEDYQRRIADRARIRTENFEYWLFNRPIEALEPLPDMAKFEDVVQDLVELEPDRRLTYDEIVRGIEIRKDIYGALKRALKERARKRSIYRKLNQYT